MHIAFILCHYDDIISITYYFYFPCITKLNSDGLMESPYRIPDAICTSFVMLLLIEIYVVLEINYLTLCIKLVGTPLVRIISRI